MTWRIPKDLFVSLFLFYLSNLFKPKIAVVTLTNEYYGQIQFRQLLFVIDLWKQGKHDGMFKPASALSGKALLYSRRYWKNIFSWRLDFIGLNEGAVLIDMFYSFLFAVDLSHWFSNIWWFRHSSENVFMSKI